MLGLAFLLTYFLSFDAMVVSLVPGIIAFAGSTVGLTVCAWNVPYKNKENKPK